MKDQINMKNDMKRPNKYKNVMKRPNKHEKCYEKTK